MDEAALIRGLRASDRHALEEAVGQYTHYLTAVAARAMACAPDREDLEEVVSDTFLALWRFRDNLDPERPLRPWLAVAARNLAVSRLRSRKSRRSMSSSCGNRRRRSSARAPTTSRSTRASRLPPMRGRPSWGLR